MFKRFYHYRGFEIGIQPQLISNRARPHVPFGGYRCIVSICKVDSGLQLDTLLLAPPDNPLFDDELDAIAQACCAAEQRIDFHLRIATCRRPVAAVT
jgi:hypothetical protein